MGITAENKEAIKQIYEETSVVNQRLWECLIKKESSQTDENARVVVKNTTEANQKKDSEARIEEASSDERNIVRENASPGASLWLTSMRLKCLFQTLTKGE